MPTPSPLELSAAHTTTRIAAPAQSAFPAISADRLLEPDPVPYASNDSRSHGLPIARSFRCGSSGVLPAQHDNAAVGVELDKGLLSSSDAGSKMSDRHSEVNRLIPARAFAINDAVLDTIEHGTGKQHTRHLRTFRTVSPDTLGQDSCSIGFATKIIRFGWNTRSPLGLESTSARFAA